MQSFQSCTHAGPGIANEREACLLIAHSGSSTSTPSAAEALLSTKGSFKQRVQTFLKEEIQDPRAALDLELKRELQTSGVTEVLKILDGSFGLPSSLTHKVERAKNYIGSEPIGTLWANLSAKATDIKHIVHTILKLTEGHDTGSRVSSDEHTGKPWDVRLPSSLASRILGLRKEVEDLKEPQPGRGWSTQESRFDLIFGPETELVAAVPPGPLTRSRGLPAADVPLVARLIIDLTDQLEKLDGLRNQRADIVSKASALAANDLLAISGFSSDIVESSCSSGAASAPNLGNYALFAEHIATGKGQQEKALHTIKKLKFALLQTAASDEACRHRREEIQKLEHLCGLSESLHSVLGRHRTVLGSLASKALTLLEACQQWALFREQKTRVLEELRKEMFLYAKDCVTDGRRESNSLYSVYPVTNLREHSTGSSSTQLKTLPPLVFMAS